MPSVFILNRTKKAPEDNKENTEQVLIKYNFIPLCASLTNLYVRRDDGE